MPAEETIHRLRLLEARYWVTAIDGLFSNELGTGPDMNDIMLWNRWGVIDDMTSAIKTLKDLRSRYQAILDGKPIKEEEGDPS